MKKSLLLFSLFAALASQAQYVTTIAGTAGTKGNTASSVSIDKAVFSSPYGMTFDNNGNLFISDYEANCIRLIDLGGGNVYNKSGYIGNASNSVGFKDGVSTSALYNGPSGMTSSSTGLIYIADRDNNCIRKLDKTGNSVTNGQQSYTVAGVGGNNGAGFKDANGTSAKFNKPTDVIMDANGNLYVTDMANHLIRKISSSGDVTTFAGTQGTSGSKDGNGTSATFNLPRCLAWDGNGNILVCDAGTGLLRKITPSGDVSTITLSKTFSSPYDIVVDGSGNIYVADNNEIKLITNQSTLTTFVGKNGSATGYLDGAGTSARFTTITGLAISPDKTCIYACDQGNSVIRKIDLKPVVDFVASTTTPNVNGQVNFTNLTPMAIRTGVTWTWTVSGTQSVDYNLNGGTLNDSSIKVVFLKKGVYGVSLKGTNAIGSNTMNKDSYIVVGGGNATGLEVIDALTFDVFPNPATDVLNLHNINFQPDLLQLIDVSGRVVYSQTLNSQESMQLSTSTWPRGMYFLMLKGSNGAGMQKIILE